MRRVAAIRIGVSGGLAASLLGVLVLASVFVARAPADDDRAPPLIGANYTHYAFRNCDLNDAGVVLTYDEPSVRTTVRRQLAAMRAAGIETLRLLLWHGTFRYRSRSTALSAPRKLRGAARRLRRCDASRRM